MAFINLPLTVSSPTNAITSVATSSDLSLVGNTVGNMRYVQDTQTLVIWSGSEWSDWNFNYPLWTKYSFDYTTFATNNTLNFSNLTSLAAGQVIHMMIVVINAAFGGGGITSYALGIGTDSDATTYININDATALNPGDILVGTALPAIQSVTGTTHIKMGALSTDADLDQATQGSADVYVAFSNLPL